MKKVNGLTSLIICIFIGLPIIVGAQDNNKKESGRRYLHHEIPGDKYAPNPYKNLLSSPAYKYESSIFFTTQVNVNEDGENIVGDAANEPSIAVDPTNPSRMVIGWRQFDNINSSFRQAGYGYSSDWGQTWTFPGVIDPGVFRSDPVLDCDSEGRFYYNSLTLSGEDYLCNVYKNMDDGFEWDGGTFAQGGDKQWMVIDRTNGIGAGNIYSFWTSYYSYCAPDNFTRSTNSGSSYEDCVLVNGEPYWGTMAVGPEGEVYVAGSGWGGITVAKSINAQNPSEIVSWDSYYQVNLDGELAGWTEINPEGLQGQAYIDVDRSGGPGNGNVYVLASVARYSNSDPADVMFAKSTNGGASWNAPIRINDDSGINDFQWFGTMSVAPTGRIDAVWLDTRDDPSGNLWSALYYSYSIDEGETWSANEKLSDIFNPHVGWPVQQKMGDYFDMESDETSAHLAWANTLNGEQDVYYGHITPQLTSVEKDREKQDFISLTNYPNPFRETTTIRYILPVNSDVKLVIYDVYGKEIKTLVDKKQQSGTYNLTVTSDEIKEGIGYCRLIAGGHTQTIMMTQIK